MLPAPKAWAGLANKMIPMAQSRTIWEDDKAILTLKIGVEEIFANLYRLSKSVVG